MANPTEIVIDLIDDSECADQRVKINIKRLENGDIRVECENPNDYKKPLEERRRVGAVFRSGKLKQILAYIRLHVRHFFASRMSSKNVVAIDFSSSVRMDDYEIKVFSPTYIFGALQLEISYVNDRIRAGEITANLYKEKDRLCTKMDELIPVYYRFLLKETMDNCEDVLNLLFDLYEPVNVKVE